uniref:helix-turn-helix domain-containing protein n=1 Tax=Ezakiella massiliensis TaxID=1852374 RepID=UPI00094EE0F2|nr:helix-turn-helix transcriptional regulator [Ezakiella massiliensis]
MINLTDMGKRIKDLREEAGLSQISLSKYLSIDESTLSKIERGTRSMNSEDIGKLASLFCCPVKYILHGGDRAWECSLSIKNNDLDIEDIEALAVINNLAKNQFEMDMLIGDIVIEKSDTKNGVFKIRQYDHLYDMYIDEFEDAD